MPANAKVNFIGNFDESRSDVLVVPVFQGAQLGKKARGYDDCFEGTISSSLETLKNMNVVDPSAKIISEFNGLPNQSVVLSAPKGSGFKNVILLGMGKRKDMNEDTAKVAGVYLQKVLSAGNYKSALLLGESSYGSGVNTESFYAELANAFDENSYSFEKYKTGDTTKKCTLNVAVSDQASAQKAFSFVNAPANAKMWAQDLGNEPPNVLYPESYAEEIKEILEPLGVKVSVLNVDQMRDEKMGAALAVGESSEFKPCMVVMEWDGTNGKQKKPVGLVGKGLTIDTGGYNIKTQMMQLMKLDMCGSASVVGAMKALAKQNAATNVVAIVGLSENRVSRDALLPGAIITSANGKTIEVGNTDAEGRLVLADAMTYLQKYYKPHTVIDVATLTGACIAAHGYDKAGFFTNDKKLVKQFNKAAENTGEYIAHDPIEQKHRNAMKGKLADLSNMGNIREDGHITAAAFLENFVEGNIKWAHIDIAGTAIPKSGMASGYGVKLLTEWINENHSVKKPATKTALALK
jgi:leucyl aminopeptidase